MGTLLNRRRVMGSQKMVEIEYLENRDTKMATAPYIKTDYLANANTVVQVKIYIPSEYQNNIGNRRRFIFGGRQSWSDSNCFAFNYKGSSPSYFGYNMGVKTNDSLCSAAYDTMYDIEVSSTNVNVNGTDYAISSANVSDNTYTQDIFGLNNKNSHNAEFKMVGRIYFIKFLELGEVKLDLIPVRVGTTGYMYDKVSETLFGNEGTSDFVLGPDKT
jgi:hypothetical protein